MSARFVAERGSILRVIGWERDADAWGRRSFVWLEVQVEVDGDVRRAELELPHGRCVRFVLTGRDGALATLIAAVDASMLLEVEEALRGGGR